MEYQDPYGIVDDEAVVSGPLWRHALWTASVAILSVGLGWIGALFRIGPEEYGLPPAAPGPVWPYLAAWTAIGLLTAAVLRVTASRVPVYSPGLIAMVLIVTGTRLSLGWRPEAPLLGALAVAAVVAAALWCALALRGEAKAARQPRASSPPEGPTSPHISSPP
jgi:hypothetical protein